MHVIKRQPLLEFARLHPPAATPLGEWYRVAEKATWTNLMEVRATYPHADAVTVASGNSVTVFNIGAGKYRLVTAIHYNARRVFILRVLTHAEYDRETWKDRL